ncbi:MAG: SemiSWEET family transporter [Candidatus Thermoplasmatota archaeon]|nr:SemiSWEET family transporter [Candidatus Thermoplasmatota archaeon]
MDWVELVGFAGAIITSAGFVPQIIRGYQTKKLDDVSYLMPVVLTIGMSCWLAYGILKGSASIIAANIFAISCNAVLFALKARYSKK